MQTINLDQASQIYDVVSHVVFAIVIIATMIVQLTPTKADDKWLDKTLKKFHKYMSFFPTLGQNPMTKEALSKQENYTGD